MNFKTVTAIASLTLATAGSAFAQGVAPNSAVHQAQDQAEISYGVHHGTGFLPADIAAGVVGGAVGTVGAMAAAPFGAGPYVYGNRPYNVTCQPGTRFRGEDGRLHICR